MDKEGFGFPVQVTKIGGGGGQNVYKVHECGLRPRLATGKARRRYRRLREGAALPSGDILQLCNLSGTLKGPRPSLLPSARASTDHVSWEWEQKGQGSAVAWQPRW